MGKQRVNLTIDSDIWLYFKTLEDVNLSDSVNQILRFQMKAQKEDRDEKELEDEIQKLRQQKDELDNKIIKLSTALMKKREEKEQQKKQEQEYHKQEMEEVDYINKSVKNSGQWQDML